MTTPPKEAIRSGFLLHDVSRLRRTLYDYKLKPLGITRSQWWVLVNLIRHNDAGLMQIELARLLDVGKVTLGGLIDRLEESGFVERIQGGADRRTKRVVITDQGKALVQQVESLAQNVHIEIMRGISTEEQRVFIDLLARMKRNLIDMDALPLSNAPRRKREG